MSHRAPKQGNRLASDDVRVHANTARTPAKPAAPVKKRQVATKTKRLPTAPPPPPGLIASKEILGLFERTFSGFFERPDIHALQQTVKGHLFNRDYAAAFGAPEHLEAYIARWSPSRALCYRTVFLEINDLMKDVFDVALRDGAVTEVLCIGGGAGAELVAAAAVVKGLLPKEDPRFEHPPPTTSKLHMTAVDVAEWTPAFDLLNKNITVNFIPEKNEGIFSADFVLADVLKADLTTLIRPKTKLITLCFTTNELYTQSRGDTTKMLLSFASLVEKGCLLLVLESAGSYSTVQIGGKTFSMGMLLDHTLTGPNGDWEVIVAEEAKWFRLPQPQMVNGQVIGSGLKYPLALENMRYFVRVFRRL